MRFLHPTAILTEAGAEKFRIASEKHIAFVREHFLGRFSEGELEQMAGFWRRFEQGE
jgi:hypothetical protein